jgi:hypothetical protein
VTAQTTIPFEQEQLLRSELSRYEKLLWWGQPAAGLRLRPSDAVMIPFSLMWGGFAIFWEVAVLTASDSPGTASPDMVVRSVFPLFGIPFVVIGLYLIVGRFFADAAIRARTYYALTDRRVIIVTGFFSRTVRSVNLRTAPEIGLREMRNGLGTVSFASPVTGRDRSWNHSGPDRMTRLVPAFELITDARRVYELALGRQAELLQPPG